MTDVAAPPSAPEPAPGGRPARRPAVPPRVRSAAIALGAGLLLCLSLPPWGWWPLAVVGLVLVDRLVADRGWRARFARGALVGLGIYVPSLLWMQGLTVPGYGIAVALYSVWLGAVFAASPPGRARWLALPGAWALIELFRWSWPFGGVPLSNLAIGQVSGPLAPTLRVGGGLLLLLTVLVAGMAAAAAVRGQWRWAGGLGAGVVAAVLLAMLAPQGHEIGRADVALVQGGGPQGTRKTATSVIEVFERHVAATDGVRTPVDLVVWPEDVVDTDAALVDDPWADEISAIARALEAPMVVGAVEGAGPRHFRNASVLFDAQGRPVDRYDKVHRVPFGEFTPLRSLLEPIAGDSLQTRDAIAGDGPGHLDTPAGRMAVPISWEVFFPDRSREGVQAGAVAILNPTNGASFTGTLVQTQQIASSRMRAIENGRWVLQVAPTGFSAVIDSDGTVHERSAISESTVIQREVGLREGLTIYSRIGLAPGVLLAVLGLLTGWVLQVRAGRRPRRATLPPTPDPG